MPRTRLRSPHSLGRGLTSMNLLNWGSGGKDMLQVQVVPCLKLNYYQKPHTLYLIHNKLPAIRPREPVIARTHARVVVAIAPVGALDVAQVARLSDP